MRRRDPGALGANRRFEIAQYLRTDANPYIKALVASAYRNFPQALELSAGLILEAQGDTAGAHEAYLRSAAEDLGFHLAHLRLATMALQRGDTPRSSRK